MPLSKIIVLDFGSQYAHLIAKRFRALGYYSEIALPSASLSEIEGAKGIVLSGGPASVYDENIPAFNESIFDSDIPILGLCYGHQLMAQHYGGTVEKGEAGEFGIAHLTIDKNTASPLFSGIASPMQVWMSHQDEVTKIADGFERTGSTENCKYAALQNLAKKRFSLQFHCEVSDTPCGNAVFENFARFCGMEKNWDEKAVLEMIIGDIRREAKDKNVLLFLSGGVDSSVTFALLNKALGQDRVLGLHIDNGFMRKGESKAVAEHYRAAGFTNFIVEDASERFLKAVSGLTDPQKKRVAVGETFIEVRNAIVAERHLDGESWMLAQGTLYPDIIESGGTKNSNVIKTHHNRVEGIQSLIEKGLIIEPLKNLYKDEVRNIGKKLGLASSLIRRHPFPGTGGERQHHGPGMNGADVFLCRRYVKIRVGDEVDLVEDGQRRLLKDQGILHRLVVPLRHGKHHRLSVLPQGKFRRADKIAHVLDDEEIQPRSRERRQCLFHHRRVQMTAAAGIDLNHRHAVAGDAVSVLRGEEIPLDDRHLHLVLEGRHGLFQERRLP
mgnify:CR=1 FL=1